MASFLLDAPASWPEKILRFGILFLALLCLAATQARACGPDFPNNLLDSGDYAVLVAPRVRFGEELERMQLVQTRWHAVINTSDYPQETADAELADLRAALKRRKIAPEEIGRICDAHRVQRERLQNFVAAYRNWENSAGWNWDENEPTRQAEPKGDAPKLPALVFVPGLPEEFADYFEGACEWRNPAVTNHNRARTAWERLLDRPDIQVHLGCVHARQVLGG